MFRFKVVVLLILGLLVLIMPVAAQDTTISLGSSDDLGEFLVGPNGMTLYIFTRDPIGESVCVDRCLENWPALLVDSTDDLTVADGIPGEFGTVERPDGGDLQVTYNGLPLYYFAGDQEVGDTTGQARGAVWWVVAPADVYVLHTEELGHILAGPTGLSLYIFVNDEMGDSTCYDQCAENWPPLLVDEMDSVVGDPRLPGELGTTERTDGTYQVTYNSWPLYYFAQDAAPGDVLGEGRGDVWYTLSPEVLLVSSSDELGDFLVDANGMTVYLFTNDEEGVSNCTDTCLENWPAVTLYPGDRVAGGPGVSGAIGTIAREDDTIQLTYNGMPLYYFAQDAAPGDTTGQGRGDVWFVVEP